MPEAREVRSPSTPAANVMRSQHADDKATSSPPTDGLMVTSPIVAARAAAVAPMVVWIPFLFLPPRAPLLIAVRTLIVCARSCPSSPARPIFRGLHLLRSSERFGLFCYVNVRPQSRIDGSKFKSADLKIHQCNESLFAEFARHARQNPL